MIDKYILIGKTPTIEPDLFKWAEWMEFSTRHVTDELVGDRRISTVFLGLDHNYSNIGPPLLFETMVFPECDICIRYSTWDEAEAGHKRIVQDIKEGKLNPASLSVYKRNILRFEIITAILNFSILIVSSVGFIHFIISLFHHQIALSNPFISLGYGLSYGAAMYYWIGQICSSFIFSRKLLSYSPKI